MILISLDREQERHQDVVRVSNTHGRENLETGETVTLWQHNFNPGVEGLKGPLKSKFVFYF